MITEEDWNNWWSSPVAREFKAMLGETKDRIAHSMPVLAKDHNEVLFQSGRYDMADEILNTQFENIKE